MGLIADIKKEKIRKALIEILAEYNVSINDLLNIHEMVVNKDKKSDYKHYEMSEEDKKKLNESKYLTPEQIISAFSGDVEELYIDGKPKESDNRT